MWNRIDQSPDATCAMTVFVINLQRRCDRHRWMRSVLPRQIDAQFTTMWDGPVDGKFITADALRGYGLFPWQVNSPINEWWNRPLKKGEIGCAISHWLCWQKAKSSDNHLFFILEDDIFFAEQFLPKLNNGLSRLSTFDPEWDLLYLGRVPLEPDVPAIDGIVKPGYSHCTFAYMLTRSGVDKLLATFLNKAIIPVDEFLPAMYTDHPRKDVRQRYRKRLSAYAFDPPLVFQLPKPLAGSDTEDSDFYLDR